MVDGPFPFVAAIAAVETIQGRHVWRRQVELERSQVFFYARFGR